MPSSCLYHSLLVSSARVLAGMNGGCGGGGGGGSAAHLHLEILNFEAKTNSKNLGAGHGQRQAVHLLCPGHSLAPTPCVNQPPHQADYKCPEGLPICPVQKEELATFVPSVTRHGHESSPSTKNEETCG